MRDWRIQSTIMCGKRDERSCIQKEMLFNFIIRLWQLKSHLLTPTEHSSAITDVTTRLTFPFPSCHSTPTLCRNSSSHSLSSFCQLFVPALAIIPQTDLDFSFSWEIDGGIEELHPPDRTVSLHFLSVLKHICTQVHHWVIHHFFLHQVSLY